MSLQEGLSGITWGSVSAVLLRIKAIVLGQMALGDLVTTQELLSTTLLAALGAIVGFFVHLILKTIVKKIQKKKEL